MKDDLIAILIVDDEPEARELLTMLLEPIEGIKIAGYAENVDGAVTQVNIIDPDLILLDIQMPGKNGFELVDHLHRAGRDTGYIFVSAYHEFAIQAIRAAAFDYLLKPVDPEQLKQAIERFRVQHQQKILHDRIDELLNSMGIGRRIKLNTRTGFFVIDPREILCCNADGNYTEIVLANNRYEVISSNLGSMEKELEGNGFFRVSRSALINISYLTHVNTKNGTCRLQGQSVVEVKVARNRLSKLEKTWGL